MAVDLVIYVLFFYAGRAIPPASTYTSFPGNYGLCVGWIIAHFPTAAVLTLPDSLLWLSVFQDVWLAALILLWRHRRKQ
jgi:Na+-driven multidrug efflux pump